MKKESLLEKGTKKRKGSTQAPKSNTLRSDSTATTDRLKIEKQLREAGLTSTVYFRDEMGIASPAPRIFELRHFGKRLNIQTIMKEADDASGKIHRYAHYYLLPGKFSDNNTAGGRK